MSNTDNRKGLRFLRTKSIQADSTSANTIEMYRIIMRDGFHYFAIE
jgi:hypothetical protein